DFPVTGVQTCALPIFRWRGFNLHVPGDPSSAAFAIVAAAIIPGSELRIPNICLNETRTGFLDVMKLMGTGLTIEEEKGENISGEDRKSVVEGKSVNPG